MFIPSRFSGKYLTIRAVSSLRSPRDVQTERASRLSRTLGLRALEQVGMLSLRLAVVGKPDCETDERTHERVAKRMRAPAPQQEGSDTEGDVDGRDDRKKWP